MTDRFPEEVARELRYYIYRLIDPRNGETFYVGKGKVNRVFEHAKAASSLEAEEESDDDLKFRRIREIQGANLQVGHIIHCHGIDNEELAFRFEAAIMDAYPGLTNKVSGHDAGEFGVAHSDELIARYRADPFEPKHKIILISIGVTSGDKSIYDAVRYAWSIDPVRAADRLVIAHIRGLACGVFEPERWIPATQENFPGFPIIPSGKKRRFGFIGNLAQESLAAHYLNRRVPDRYRRKGAANPIRFIDPS